MLVVLDSSLSEITPNDFAAISGLESILTSSYNGEHFLTCDFITVRNLIKLPLSIKGKAVLQRLRSEIFDHGHLPYPNSFVTRINLNGKANKTSVRTWELPISDFKNKSFPSSVVLGENMLDAAAFISSAKQARSKHRRKEHCAAIPDAGGGSQTAIKLSGHVNNHTGLCYCITDGDYREPSWPKSAVTLMCEKIAQSSATPMFATDFNARSIENIIPTTLILDSYEGNPVPTSLHRYLSTEENDPEICQFIDVKLGLKFCSIKKIPANSKSYNFWMKKLEERNLVKKFEELERNPPDCEKDGCANCILIDGLDAGVLKRSVDYFEKNSSPRLAQRIKEDSVWCTMGLSIYYWIMADKPALI
jgi:hypothetical protein